MRAGWSCRHSRAAPPITAPGAPLLATLQHPDGRSHDRAIDPRTVAWTPEKVVLNLPRAFHGSGRVTRTLSTTGTNGGYGVAVGRKGTL